MWNGVIRNEPLLAIHKQIFKDTINFQKQNGYSPEAFKKQAYAYAKVGKKAYKQALALGLVGVSILDHVFTEINKVKHMDKMDHQVFEYARHVEANEKENIIDEEIGEARSNHMVFYIVSKHGDCAEDHLNWQGKIYIDEKWRSVCNQTEIDAITEYIGRNRIRTFQWVIFRPVWMITRPNCRHYFKRLYTNTVLKKSVDEILRENNMISAKGKKRNIQSIQHDTRESWYTEENVDGILWQYEKRKRLHEKMKASNPCPAIQRAIQKDKLLINRWKGYKKQFF